MPERYYLFGLIIKHCPMRGSIGLLCPRAMHHNIMYICHIDCPECSKPCYVEADKQEDFEGSEADLMECQHCGHAFIANKELMYVYEVSV